MENTKTMQNKLVTGGLLIDGTAKKPLKDGAVLIEGKKIAAVGTRRDFTDCSCTEVIDCSDQVLMPGMVDAHNHLSLDSSIEDYLQHMQDPIPVLTIRALKTMKADLNAGVTTIRCLGDRGYLDMACRAAVASNTVPGPRLVTAGKGIRAAGAHGYVGYPYEGTADMCAAVRENVNAGADIIKFYVTGTLPGDKKVQSFLSRQEIFAIAAEASQHARSTAVHCIGGEGLDWCLEAGIDSIEHGYFLTDDQIRKIVDSGTWLVLTPSFYLCDDRVRALPQPLVESHFAAQGLACEVMRTALAAGVRFAVGTDGVHGEGALAEEAAWLVELGASNEAVLATLTREGAELCGLGEITGTLEPGKEADIIGLNHNPLEDIRALAGIRTVIKQGKVVDFLR